MKRFRTAILAIMALTLPACGVWQCAAGKTVTQSVVIENNGLLLIAVIVVCGLLFLAGLLMLLKSDGLGGGGQ